MKTILNTLKEFMPYYQITSFIFKDFFIPYNSTPESNKEDKNLSRELFFTDFLLHVEVHSWGIDIYADADVIRRDFVSNIPMQLSQLE